MLLAYVGFTLRFMSFQFSLKVVSRLCLDVDYFDQLALCVSSETLRFGPSQLSNRRPAVGTSDGTGHDNYNTPRWQCKRSTMSTISHNIPQCYIRIYKVHKVHDIR